MKGSDKAGAASAEPGSARKRRRAIGSADDAPCAASPVQLVGSDLDDASKPCRTPQKPRRLPSASTGLSPPPGATGTIRRRRGAALVAITGGVVPAAAPSSAGGSSLADGKGRDAGASARQVWGSPQRLPRTPPTVISPSKQRPPATARLQKQIPKDHAVLLDMFAALHGVVAVMRRRGQRCTFEALKASIEQQSRRRFEMKHLAQMKHVYPNALHWEHIAVPRAAPGMQGASPRVDIQLVVDVRCDAPASDMDAYGSPVVTATLRRDAAAAASDTPAASSDGPSSAAKRRLFSTDAAQPAAPVAAAAGSADVPGDSALPATPPAVHSGSRGGRADSAATPPAVHSGSRDNRAGSAATLPEHSWRAELGQSPAGSAARGSTGTLHQQGTGASATPQRTMLAMREEMAHRLALDYAAQYRAHLVAAGHDAAGMPLDAEQWACNEELWGAFRPQPVPQAPLPPVPDTSGAPSRHSGGGYLTPSPLAAPPTSQLPPAPQGKAAAAPPGLPRKKARRLDFGAPGGPMPVHSRFAAAVTDISGGSEAAAAAGAADCSDDVQGQRGPERQHAPLSNRRGSSAALAAALRDYTGDGSEIPDSVWQAVAAGELPVSLRAVQAARRNEAAGQRAHGEDAVTARRRQNADSKLLEAYRFLRSQFEGKPRVQPLAEVLKTMSTNGKFGDGAACELQLRVLQEAAPGWLTQQAGGDGGAKLAINRSLTAPMQPKVMAAMAAAMAAHRQGRAAASAAAQLAAQPGRGQLQTAAGPAAAGRISAGTATAAAGGARASQISPAEATVTLSAEPEEAPAPDVRRHYRVRFAVEVEASPSAEPPSAELRGRGTMLTADADEDLQADAESPPREAPEAPRPPRPALKQATLPTGRRTPQRGTPRKPDVADDEAAGSGRERPGFGLGRALFPPDMRF